MASKKATGPLAVEWTPIDRLQLNPSNPRINDAAVPHVAASLARFGWQQPVVAKRSGEVVAGNTRLKAARSLGMESVPVVWFGGSDLDAVAYGIADNKLHELSSFDPPALAKLLDELRREDASFDGLGFSSDEVNELLAEMEAANADLTDPDAIPAMPDAATTQPGDVWLLGKHRVMSGDSANASDVDRLLGGEKIHLVHTDPPYNVRVEPRSNNAIAAGLSSFGSASAIAASDARGMHHQGFDLARDKTKARASTRKLRPRDRALENDFVSDEEFVRLLRAWFGNMTRVLEPGRAAYIWGGYANVANYPAALKEAGLYFSQAIIWVKEHPVLTRKDFMGNHEWCFYSWREGAAHYFNPKINNATDVWSVKKVNPQSMVHLTEKPVELSVRAMTYSSRAGENVLDLFGGSGSTLIGAESLGRRAFLMELDTLYCDVIVRRWEQVTGKKATLEGSGGKSFEATAAERGVPCSTG
jgi:DNA modification methylase